MIFKFSNIHDMISINHNLYSNIHLKVVVNDLQNHG